MHQCLDVLRPFHQATVELSEEKQIVAKLATNLKNNLNEKCAVLLKVTALFMATLLDPRFKELGFCNQGCTKKANERLTKECAATMQT